MSNLDDGGICFPLSYKVCTSGGGKFYDVVDARGTVVPFMDGMLIGSVAEYEMLRAIVTYANETAERKKRMGGM